jgi:hypothetical protein
MNFSSFTIRIAKTYYNKGFINVPISHANNFLSEDKFLITIKLAETNEQITGYVSRTANKNYTPRIFGRHELTNWFKSNLSLYDIIKVKIVAADCVKIEVYKKYK